ncbi:ceramide kinase [Anthonomus grandis grandis]|uniref:ceramide kinase n=1 Tax=Anthonomus grandis grandis TaxID=2921223 RepID=UPI002166591C|nr:ceramide kinase [Anthonomus grandis grandis]
MSDPNHSVLLSTFVNGKKKVKIIFHKEVLVWENEKAPLDQHTVPIENVLSVEHCYLKETHPSLQREIDYNQFIIHYAEKSVEDKWVYKSIILQHSDPLQVASWVKTLKNHLAKFHKRPKHLLLFVNPFGGKQNAMQIYEKYGKALFAIAGVEVTVNVSQRKDQIKDFLITHNLDMFDAVACVGGDGTVSEMFNGLVLRECRSTGIDANDIHQTLPKPKIPIGIIPGGSTDTIAYCLHGTSDPTTAVLQIIFGDTVGLDLVSVYDEHHLLRLYASVLSYGYLGDVAFQSDQYRWMGPLRYDYSGFKKLVLNKGYHGEIAIYTDKKDVEKQNCKSKCETCDRAASTQEKINCKWETIRGKFFMVSGANISCACSRSPQGIAPYCHLGDGKVNLVLVKHTSFVNIIKLLLRLSSPYASVEDLPFVETISAREFCFRAIDKSNSKWNCDGEVQHQTNIRAKVRCQLLTIFSRGSDKLPNTKGSCCNF